MKKPYAFIILRIVGICFLAIALFGIVLAIIGFGDFETNRFMIGALMTVFGLFIGVSCTVMGFLPEISKTTVQTQKYIQSENKDDLKEIADTQAEINANAVTTLARAAADGFSGKQTLVAFAASRTDPAGQIGLQRIIAVAAVMAIVDHLESPVIFYCFVIT
jgi:hypothetical protein